MKEIIVVLFMKPRIIIDTTKFLIYVFLFIIEV